MPVYDYQCKSCEHIFERTLKIADSDTPKNEPCPNCGATGNVDRYFGSCPKLIDPFHAGRYKLNSDFRDKLKAIKKKNPGSNINEYGLDR